MSMSFNSSIFGRVILALGIGALHGVSVAGSSPTSAVETSAIPFVGSASSPKNLFIFFDGTSNIPKDRTNVRRMFEFVAATPDQQKMGLYLSGVGTDSYILTGNALGKGMEGRITDALEYICVHFKPKDRVHIFGFSRGAHQARALAGILAYSGVPSASCSRKTLNDVIEITKKAQEKKFVAYWSENWTPTDEPPLADKLTKKVKVQPLAVPVAFLGIWDTVPGSSLKGYDNCRERIGIVKKAGWLIPGVDEGERYKVLPYPTIGHIAHALSADEKRSKFQPLLVCDRTRSSQVVNEVWFPGAHSDVGGGYDDMSKVNGGSLPQLSFKWMLGELATVYAGVSAAGVDVEGAAEAVAHWSLSSPQGNIGSECIDRVTTSGGKVDSSIEIRKRARLLPVNVNGKCVMLPYPVLCADIGRDKTWNGATFRGVPTEACHDNQNR